MTDLDVTTEVAIRRARMDAARGSSAAIAAMAAGAGAELVARHQRAREILIRRLRKAGRDPVAVLGAAGLE